MLTQGGDIRSLAGRQPDIALMLLEQGQQQGGGVDGKRVPSVCSSDTSVILTMEYALNRRPIRSVRPERQRRHLSYHVWHGRGGLNYASCDHWQDDQKSSV